MTSIKTYPRVALTFRSLAIALLAALLAPTPSAQGGSLMWSTLDYVGLNWDTAVAEADLHVEAGFDDWRLPTVQELIAATQDGTFGTMTPNVSAWDFWSSERRGNRAYSVVVASDANGEVIASQSGEVLTPLRGSSLCAKYVRDSVGPPSPGITLLGPTTGLLTAETGLTDEFQVVLDTEPVAPVHLTIYTSDATEGL